MSNATEAYVMGYADSERRRDELARLFAKFIPTPNMSRRLYRDFLAAGFSCPQCRFDGPIDGGASNPVYEIFAQAGLSLLSHVATADERFTCLAMSSRWPDASSKRSPRATAAAQFRSRSSVMRDGFDPGLSCRAEKSGAHPDGRVFPPWQVSETALITLLAPPRASLVLPAIYYVEYRATVPFSPPDFLVAFVLLAMPIGYVFGAAPALLGASLYCALLTLHSRLFAGRSWLRVCVGAVCGGLASWSWFLECLGVSWNIYGSVGALVMAVMSLRSRISRAIAPGPATPGAMAGATEEKHAAFPAK